MIKKRGGGGDHSPRAPLNWLQKASIAIQKQAHASTASRDRNKFPRLRNIGIIQLETFYSREVFLINHPIFLAVLRALHVLPATGRAAPLLPRAPPEKKFIKGIGISKVISENKVIYQINRLHCARTFRLL
ncbi:hypothetical protein GWI33_004628 [Rhynchophorus ferrugineus]|uniref:Uncharacterized protein n=1 Tax=Rhynchophorus ferrugineus TaxID=354439 RepID=A0A834MJV0_RHYFE|nr:hypothetical protein GWI33_004628 [Rhynchophorus ferrugineus]